MLKPKLEAISSPILASDLRPNQRDNVRNFMFWRDCHDEPWPPIRFIECCRVGNSRVITFQQVRESTSPTEVLCGGCVLISCSFGTPSIRTAPPDNKGGHAQFPRTCRIGSLQANGSEKVTYPYADPQGSHIHAMIQS